MNGVLLIDKPKEFTSFDVIAVVRGLTGQRKAGHTGTLDPNATGVLPVLLGSATKAQDLIPNHDKKYIADLKLGMTTDTLDIWGKELTKTESDITGEELESALDGFRGEIWQLPPMFSAVQKNGQRLYDLARKGMEVEREKRKVTVYSLALLEFDRKTQCGKLEVFCSKGTYVRTIIDDIGAKLGVGAVMTGLRRVEACGFSIDDCLTLDELKELKEQGELSKALRSAESLFSDYPALYISPMQAKRFSNGGALDVSRTSLRDKDPSDKQIFRVRENTAGFLGLGIFSEEKNQIKIYKLFK